MNEQRSYHFKPNPNLPTHYTPALRNHENFSYGGGAQQSHRPGQNYQRTYIQPRFQEQQQQRDIEEIIRVKKRTQSLEDQMLHFMSENKRILNLHEKKFSALENFQANTTVLQTNTNASLKNLEIQIGQLAQAMQKEPKDSFPSDKRKNPKDCMAVILRSGRELDEMRGEKKDTEEEKQA